MNTPKLPPLTKELEDHLSWYSDPKADRIRAMIRDYTIAAIQAQGVPDGYAGSLYVSGSEHCVTVEFESAAQAQAYQNWLASAPPVPQAADDSAASVNDTNAALASRYFELLKVVEQYEKSGVTCQTYRHFISEPCAECNSPGICGKQAKPQPDPLHDDIQSVLFEVEQSIENGSCPWQIEAAFEAYEAARRLQQPAHGIKG